MKKHLNQMESELTMRVKQTSLKLLDFQMYIFVAQAGDRPLQTNCSYARPKLI